MTGIDFHAHIVPAADHGCKSLSQAEKQLLMMKDAGIGTVVATPHFYPSAHNVHAFLSRREEGLKQLRTVSPADRPKIIAGAEVLLCQNLHSMPDFDRLCIPGTRVLLLELPYSDITNDILFTVEAILDLDYTVVLAHIDRYLPKYEKEIAFLLSIGALAQINVSSLHGFFARKRILPYLDQNYVVAFGSDMHGTDKDAMANYAALRNLPNQIFETVCRRTACLLENAERF